jgi:hypothetical protein
MQIKTIVTTISIGILLAGCNLMPTKELPPEVIVKNRVVLISLPQEFYSIPDNIEAPDMESATQRDVAEWITRNELRTTILENKLIQLRNYYVFSQNLLASVNGQDSVIVVDPTAGAGLPTTEKPSFKLPNPLAPVTPTKSQPKEITNMFRPQPAFIKVGYAPSLQPAPTVQQPPVVKQEIAPPVSKVTPAPSIPKPKQLTKEEEELLALERPRQEQTVTIERPPVKTERAQSDRRRINLPRNPNSPLY